MRFDREKFVNDLLSLTAREVKWLHQGSDPDVGLDCINLPRWAYRQQKELPEELDVEFRSYHHKPDGARLLRIMRKWFFEIAIEDSMPGDLLVLFQRRNPQHMAVIVNEDEVIEAYRGADGHVCRVLVQKLDPRRRIAAVFRIPDFA